MDTFEGDGQQRFALNAAVAEVQLLLVQIAQETCVAQSVASQNSWCCWPHAGLLAIPHLRGTAWRLGLLVVFSMQTQPSSGTMWFPTVC